MKSEIKDIEKTKKEISVDVSKEEFAPYIEQAAKKLSKNLQIPGFRPGHIPFGIIKENIGIENILEEAVSKASNDFFLKAVKEGNLTIVGTPQGRIEKLSEDGFSLSAQVEVLDEVILPDYKKIAKETSMKEVSVSEEEVKETLQSLQKSRAKFKKVLREAKKGDFVVIDGEIRFGNAKIENGDIKDQSFILFDEKNKFIPGFEEQILGMREGEEKSFSLMAPSNFWKKELQGKPLDIKIKLKELFELELPEINDEFAKNLGNFQNKDDLEKSIREGIKIEKEDEEKQKWRMKVLEKISENTIVDIPRVLIDREKDVMIEDFKQNIERTGIPFDQYLEGLGKTVDDLKKDWEEDAKKRVKMMLAINEIFQKENIKVEEKEIEEKTNEFLKRYQKIEDVGKDIQSQELGEEGLDPEKLKMYIEDNLRVEKVFELLEKFNLN